VLRGLKELHIRFEKRVPDNHSSAQLEALENS
jgi:hypothetical protein